MEKQCKRREKEMNGLYGIRDIQYNQKLSKEEWERLHSVSVQELKLPVCITNMLLRSGYHTVGSLTDATIEELKQIDTGKECMQEHMLEQILEKLKELKIELPTETEKEAVLASLTETERLEREIRLLKQINAKLERENQYQQKQIAEWYKNRTIPYKDNLRNAHEIALHQDNPVEKILKDMHYGFPSEAGCSFCDIFKLYEKDCLLEYREQKGVTLQNACETCIGRFLHDYYQSNPQTGHP